MNFTATVDQMTKVSTTSRTFGSGKTAKQLTMEFFECTHGQDKFFLLNVSPMNVKEHDLVEFKRTQSFDSISMEKLVNTAAALEAKLKMYLG